MFKKKENTISFDELNISQLKSYNKPIILDFGGAFCQPCKRYEKVLEKIKEEYKDEVLIKVFDISKDVEMAVMFDVTVIPHQVFINKNGTIETTNVGYLSYDETLKKLELCGLKNR